MSIRPQSGIRGPGAVPGRPQSGIRPVTGAIRPGTGARPGTGTAAGGRVGIVKRDVTTQGLAGGKVAGPGRTVADKNYYVVELRQRITELNDEITNLSGEITRFERGNQESYALEKKMQALQPEVQVLQDRLGDYNLLLERIHMSTAALKVEDMNEQVGIFQRKNDLESKKINEAFSESQIKEQEITTAETKIYQIQQETEAALSQLDAEVKAAYDHKREENVQLQQEISEKQSLLDELTVESRNLEDALRRDPGKTKSVQLHDELRALTKEKVALEEETGAQLSVPEEIERLLQKVKQANNEIAHIDNESSTMLDAINKIRAKIAEFEKAKEDSKTDRAEKFRELARKDKEMSKFIKEYDAERVETADKISKLQSEILQLLERTSMTLQATEAMPSAHDAKVLAADVKFKEQQADLSQTTAQKLQQQLEQRKAEYAKMQSLDSKIAEEMESLEHKMKQMTEEMGTFSGIDSVRSEFQAKKEALAAEKKGLLKRKELLAQQNGMLASTNDTKERQLRDSDMHAQLELQEKSIRHYLQNNFSGQEYINQKEKEGDYKSMITQVLKMVTELNGHHQKTTGAYK